MTIKRFLRVVIDGGRVCVNGTAPRRSYPTQWRPLCTFNMSIDGLVLRPHHVEDCVLHDAGAEIDGADAMTLEIP